MPIARLLSLLFLFATCMAGGALAEEGTRQIAVDAVGAGAPAKRVALVVGNNRYVNLPEANQLVTAINDASSVKAALTAMGFDVVYGENLTRDQFLDRFSDFQSRIDHDTLALFFYAGHGVQLQNGSGNYLLPSDIMPPETTRPFEEDRLAQSSISDSYVVEGMRKAGADVAVVVLDACRTNPLSAKRDRGVLGGSQGLSRVDYPKGVFALYSAGYNETALDRLPGEGDGVNSVFTRSFIKYLPQPGLSLQELARKVGDEVDALSGQAGHSQAPAYVDQVRGRTVYLAGPPEGQGAGGSGTDNASDSREKAARMEFELAYWNSVKDSKDPGSFDLYLRQYPDGQFAALAKQKLTELTAAQKADADKAEEEARAKAQQQAQLTAPQADAETILWEAVKDSSDASRLGIYVEKYPSGRYAAEARARISGLEVQAKADKAQEELRAWEAIQYATDPQVYTDFVARYPQSTFAGLARQKAASLAAQQYSPPPPPPQQQPSVQYQPQESDAGENEGCVGSSDPIEAVYFYYRTLEARDGACARQLWVSPPRTLARKVANFGGASVQQVLSATRMGQSLAVVNVVVSVREMNGPWERYRLSIRLRLRGGIWLVDKMTSL